MQSKLSRFPKEENSLLFKSPDTAVYFDHLRNQPYKPSDYFLKSDLIINWCCPNNDNHRWHRAVKEQVKSTLKGNGCPYCSKKWPSDEYSLQACYPEVIKEWCYLLNTDLDPKHILPYSDKIAYWKCHKDPEHVYEMQIKKKTRRGYKCPICSNHRQERKKSFGALYPKLLEQWHTSNTIDPFSIAPKSDLRIYWECSKHKSHVWRTQVKNRTNSTNPTGCPFCANRIVCESNRLDIHFPHIASEWHPTKNNSLKSSDVTSGTNRKLWWQCKNGHEWQSSVSGRTSKNGRCPYCYSSTSKAEIFVYSELDYIFSHTEWRVKMHEKECDIYLPEYRMAIEVDGSYWHRDKEDDDLNKNKVLNKNGIKLIRLREQPLSLLTTEDVLYPKGNVSAQSVALLLISISKKVVLNKRDRDKAEDYLNDIKQRNEKAYLKRISNIGTPEEFEKSAASIDYVLACWDYEKNTPIDPYDVYLNSSLNVHWRCNKGHKWKARIAHVTRGSRCPYCQGNLASKETSLSATHPEIAKLWSPKNILSVLDVKAQSATKRLWVCANGHEYSRTITSQVNGKQKCPICSSLGARFPEIARGWHPEKNTPLTPFNIGARSTRLVWWQCPNSHEWLESPGMRTNIKSNYTYKSCIECRSISFLRPDIAKLIHPYKNGEVDPKKVLLHSKKKLLWLCHYCGHDWSEKVSNITSRKVNQCNKCSRYHLANTL